MLIIHLVKEGRIVPAKIDSWIARTHYDRPVIDKEAMGAILVRYKGAEAGEIDWRPAETVPEGYYAV